MKKINEKKEFTPEEEKEIELIVKKREKYQIKKISENSGKSKRPVLVFIGSWHLRKNGPIYSRFKNCKIIFPANKRGELVIEPTQEKIVYMEKKL
jgi:hypothetical protein